MTEFEKIASEIAQVAYEKMLRREKAQKAKEQRLKEQKVKEEFNTFAGLAHLVKSVGIKSIVFPSGIHNFGKEKGMEL